MNTLRFILPLALTLLLSSGIAAAQDKDGFLMSIEKRDFGAADGTPVTQYLMTNRSGLQARLMTYGATWTHMLVPDREGRLGDVLLGFDTLQPYLDGHPYFGTTTGRVANRIARGKFVLDGKPYSLATNNGPNHLHGGLKGLDKVVWQADALETPDGPAVKFTHTDPDGANGYPGTVKMEVVYTLTQDDEMRIDYKAVADKPTPINLTNHAYFNLGTPASGTVLDHVLELNADRFTPVDETLIPTGDIAPVGGTAMDFTTPAPIGKNIEKVGKNPTGYDHNYVLRGGKAGENRLVARASDPQSGRTLEIWSDQPGVQFYSGNFLDGSLTGKGGVVYRKHQGFCLETQHFPDSINRPNFPDTVLRPGQVYRTTTVHKFSAK
ncbi:MAG: galactose mutarotase [Armatimonadetes bacterium]|nr:galactose mutarotase [Armatimonadota bacterium]